MNLFDLNQMGHHKCFYRIQSAKKEIVKKSNKSHVNYFYFDIYNAFIINCNLFFPIFIYRLLLLSIVFTNSNDLMLWRRLLLYKNQIKVMSIISTSTFTTPSSSIVICFFQYSSTGCCCCCRSSSLIRMT